MGAPLHQPSLMHIMSFQVSGKILIEDILKDLIYKVLAECQSITEAKWHHKIFKGYVPSVKCGLPFISLFDLGQIVSSLKIQFEEKTSSFQMVKQFRDEWQKIPVLHINLI